MDTQNWMVFIQNVGFPIFMCCALFFNMTRVQKDLTETLDKTTDAIMLLTERIRDVEEKLERSINSTTK